MITFDIILISLVYLLIGNYISFKLIGPLILSTKLEKILTWILVSILYLPGFLFGLTLLGIFCIVTVIYWPIHYVYKRRKK